MCCLPQFHRRPARAVRMFSTMLPSALAMCFMCVSPPRHQVTSPLVARARSAPLGGRAGRASRGSCRSPSRPLQLSRLDAVDLGVELSSGSSAAAGADCSQSPATKSPGPDAGVPTTTESAEAVALLRRRPVPRRVNLLSSLSVKWFSTIRCQYHQYSLSTLVTNRWLQVRSRQSGHATGPGSPGWLSKLFVPDGRSGLHPQ